MSPNVYDQAHMLAAGVKASTEYADYRLALARLKAEPGTLRVFRDFRKRQFDLQSRLLQGQDVPAAERERFTQLSEIVAQHGPISAFLSAEFRLSRLLGDIQRIISDAVELELGLEEEDEEEQPREEAQAQARTDAGARPEAEAHAAAGPQEPAAPSPEPPKPDAASSQDAPAAAAKRPQQ